MKKLWVVVAILAAVSLFSWNKSCRSDARYKQGKLEYVGYRAIAEADHELGQKHIAELNGAIGHLTETAVQKDAKIAQYVEKTTTLRAELTALQNAEPPTTPDIEALPIVINLRAQVSNLTASFSLAQKTIAEKDGIIANKDEIIALVGAPVLVGIKDGKKIFRYPEGSVTWELNQAVEREHKLRVQAEDLFKLGERRVGLNKTIKNIALAVAGAGVAYGLLK